MEVDLETMLDIALAGPEIGPLNLHVLHGLMRKVFERIDISKQPIVVDQNSVEFSDSYNFIRSKLATIPKTSQGGYRRLKSKVSVIVSDYARAPIGEPRDERKATSPLYTETSDVDERLKRIESVIGTLKDFPSVDELHDWAKEQSNPDTVVTDLWHFVSLNHRMNGAEEGIQKLTALVDKLIPELKRVNEESLKMSGQVDDLYSQMKGLSERMSYIDGRIDATSADVFDRISDIERRTLELPDFTDLQNYVHMDLYEEAEAIAKQSVNDIREQLGAKLDQSQIAFLASKDELKAVDDKLDELDTKIRDNSKEHKKFVTNDELDDELKAMDGRLKDRLSTLENKINGKAELSMLNGKADVGMITGMEGALNHNIEKIIEALNKSNEEKDGLKGKLADIEREVNGKLVDIEMEIKGKADDADVVALTTKVDSDAKLLIDIDSWRGEEQPLLASTLDELNMRTNMLDERVSTLEGEKEEGEVEKGILDADTTEQLQEVQNGILGRMNALEKTHNEDITRLTNQLNDKLNSSDIEPLRTSLDECKEAMLQNKDGGEGMEKMTLSVYPPGTDEGGRPSSACIAFETPDTRILNGIHQPSPPTNKPKSPTNQSKRCALPDVVTPDNPFRNDGAIVTKQMKFNCLSCGRALNMQTNNCLHTTRGRPLNAYELENMRLLQTMLHPDNNKEKDKRQCGGSHTSIIPLHTNTKSHHRKAVDAVVASDVEVVVDTEVDIEGLDGRLYRGLVNKTDLPII